MLKLHKWLYEATKEMRRGWFIWRVVKLSEILFYRQRVAYRVIATRKSRAKKKKNPLRLFVDDDEFWSACALLQSQNKYAYAEYWLYLNDMFKGLAVTFIALAVMSYWMQASFFQTVAFMVLAVLSYLRAYQFADHFVATVKRQLLAFEEGREWLSN